MTDKPQVAAIDGWHTLGQQPHLVGAKCQACGTYYFPKQVSYCRNPDCDGDQFDEVPLSRHGTIWSYTNACYQPPAPFVSPDPFQPYAIAAVQLEQEQMIVLGQVVNGVGVEQLKVGDPVELVVEPLHEDDDAVKMTWKWRPTQEARP